MSDTDEYNFDGVVISGRNGTFDDTNFLNDFNSGDMLQAETLVGVALTEAGGSVTRTISDDEVDHVRLTFSFPAGLVVQYDSGKQYELSIKFKITVTPNGGSETTVLEEAVTQKAYSEFRQAYTIKNISSYGSFPIAIKCYRLTEDYVDSSKGVFNDDSNWYSYTEIKEVKLQYRNRAIVATELRAEDFGDNIPNRIWKIKGKLINYPSNYDPDTRVYTGVWDGTFSYGYTNNPAWVVYDLLINKRYGVGLAPEKVDKWALYSIGEYCDGDVTYTEAQRQPDGTYSDVDVIQPRYTFNGVISDKEQALSAINHFCSVFSGFPMWSTGLVTFGQDAPGSITRIASTANVKDGMFEYSGTSKRQRTTAVQVGWNETLAKSLGLIRGAARMQHKSWGVIITWKYDEPPYLDNGEEIYKQMVSAYEAGAEYVAVFNYPYDGNNIYGLLIDEHFEAFERFWTDIIVNKKVMYGSIEAEAALVLPMNYGWGMRFPYDRNWYWQSGERGQYIWELSLSLLSEYSNRLDIVYDDPAYPIDGKYKKISFWNESI